MRYVAIRSEGGLIPYDLLDKIANEDIQGQKPSDFGLPKGRRLTDEISRVWSDAQSLWDIFQRRRETLSEKDPYGTTLTRERWIVPLLSDPDMLGFDLKLQTSAAVVNNISFPVSHRSGDGEDAIPVHIEGLKIDLDKRLHTKLRTSPQAMVQEFLNHSESVLWGIVTNGLTFRILRDSSRTSRPTYLEFDLESILEGNRFAEFALFYRLCHRSRFPRPGKEASECLLEKYYQQSIDEGSRVREGLRDGVEATLKIVGTAFLQHPANNALRERVAAGRLTAAKFHRQLLLLVYRLLFLMVAEERKLIATQGDSADRNQKLYDEWYSVTRLRDRAGQVVEESPFSDLWIGLLKTFDLFEYGLDTNPLGIPPLNGDLFNRERAVPDLVPEDRFDSCGNYTGTQLYNHDLLRGIRYLSTFQDKGARQRVNYAALDVEELGSVYESLLDFQPVIEQGETGLGFDLRTGSERKSTGSYYTRPELVHELIESALVPVMQDRIAQTEKATEGQALHVERDAKIKAILSMTVCDPACGSGHFLLAAARRLGKELARIKTDEDEPTPEQFHLAVREVIQHCIYGVDLNPLAVDLCKVALWLEGHWAGKPLSFLDHRIKCGNSLIGVLDPAVLEQGIPDEAFTAVTGDDKKVAAYFKKKNKEERKGQHSLMFEGTAHVGDYATSSHDFDDIVEDTPADVKRKRARYDEWRNRPDWSHDWTAANIWTAAFFVPLTKFDDPEVPTYETFRRFSEKTHLAQGQLIGKANGLAEQLRFFHWRLEFPQVFQNGGFDVVLGNPPWERPEFHDDDHWTDEPYILGASDKADREKRIQEYRLSGDSRKIERIRFYEAAQHLVEAHSKFWRNSNNFPLTAKGKFNTYGLFAERATTILGRHARFGLMLQSGIGTDITSKYYLADIFEKSALVSFFDFVNLEGFFPGIHRTHPHFCAMTVSSEANRSPVEFAFYMTRTDQLQDRRRRFQLRSEELRRFNPNTGTLPTFRTGADADLSRGIYSRIPILLHDDESKNEWRLRITRIFNMGIPAVVKLRQELHHLQSDLRHDSQGNFCDKQEHIAYWRVYESKLIHQYNHRYSTYEGCTQSEIDSGKPKELMPDALTDPEVRSLSRYWLPDRAVQKAFNDAIPCWLMVFRDVTNATNERTMIAAIIPFSATDLTLRVVISEEPTERIACLLANFNALIFDYVARQFVSGMHLSDYVTEQLPVIQPSQYRQEDVSFISSRVIRLTFVACDLDGAAAQFGDAKHSQWRPDERRLIQSELDAYYAHLYGLTRDELRYILDPKDVFGEDFPSETFRVLKEREIKEYGEYRTQRLVLNAFDKLAESPRFRDEMPKRVSAFEVPKGKAQSAN